MQDETHRLAALTVGLHGVITPTDGMHAGLTTRQLRHRVLDGVLDRAGTRVLRSPHVESTPLVEVAAFVADCGESAAASGSTAAALHGFDGFELAAPFHATIPRGRSVDRRPHVVHTSLQLDPLDRTRVHGISVMTAARTLIDLAVTVSPTRLTAALDGALRDRRLTDDMLHERIVALRSSGRYGIPKLLEVIEGGEATRGGHSWLERRFLHLCADAGLPRPETQRALARVKGRLVRVDFEFAGTDVVVEVLGYRWHRGSAAQFARDAERINALVLAGRHPLQFTYDHVTAEPGWVVDQIRLALGQVCVSETTRSESVC